MELLAEFLINYKDKEGKRKYFDSIQKIPSINDYSIRIDFSEIEKYDPSLAHGLLQQGKEIISIGSIALDLIGVKIKPETEGAFNRLIPRFLNLPESHNFDVHELKTEHKGMLVSVKGLAFKVGKIKQLLVEGVFQCENCREVMIVEQTNYKFTKPFECNNLACGRKRGFELLPEESIFSDYREIELQDWRPKSNAEAMVKPLKVILLHSLVEQCQKNDIIKATGYLKLITKVRSQFAEFKKEFIANSIQIIDVKIN